MEIGLLEKTATLFNTCFKIGAHVVYYPSRYDTYRRTPRDRAAVGCGGCERETALRREIEKALRILKGEK